jgi:hypothetical protein
MDSIDGETFGAAVSEFSVSNKPVITWKDSVDKEHIRILGDKSILYTNEKDLLNIFENIEALIKSKNNWNAYGDYTPEIVMNEFKSLLQSK